MKVCSNCKKAHSRPKSKYCSRECYREHVEYPKLVKYKDLSEEQKEASRTKQRKHYNDNIEYKRQWRNAYANKRKAHYSLLRKNYRIKLREKVLKAYGSKCVCCGEEELKFLCIDHVYNDGKKHRKEVSVSAIYAWLKRNNFPKKRFQILCYNCNMAKAHYDECPHQI